MTCCAGCECENATGDFWPKWCNAKFVATPISNAPPEFRLGQGAFRPLHAPCNNASMRRDYRDGGGHLLYLGGNGFYWRIALHSDAEDILESRRAEDGIRAWAAEPGEYYNAFDGTYLGCGGATDDPLKILLVLVLLRKASFSEIPTFGYA